MKKFTLQNQEYFFDAVEIGEVFFYSESFFPKDVKKIAATHNLTVVYCPPNSEEYKMFGCHVMKVAVPKASTTITIQKKLLERVIKKLNEYSLAINGDICMPTSGTDMLSGKFKIQSLICELNEST